MKKFKKSFKSAQNGILHVYKNEINFKIHIIIAIIVLVLGLIMDWHAWKWALYIFAVSQVLVTEVLNSAIEYTWDHLEPNQHPVVGIIKDVTAGAVLISVISAMFIGIILFLV